MTTLLVILLFVLLVGWPVVMYAAIEDDVKECRKRYGTQPR